MLCLCDREAAHEPLLAPQVVGRDLESPAAPVRPVAAGEGERKANRRRRPAGVRPRLHWFSLSLSLFLRSHPNWNSTQKTNKQARRLRPGREGEVRQRQRHQVRRRPHGRRCRRRYLQDWCVWLMLIVDR